jgi:hypothetical protein
MTDPSYDALEDEAQAARARLMATLDVLDGRTKRLVHEATETARSTAFGMVGAMTLVVGLALAERASRRARTFPVGAGRRSILADTLRVGAVALVFVSVSAWAKHAAHTRDTGHAGEPQLRRVGAALLSAMLGKGPHSSARRAGTTHASLELAPTNGPLQSEPEHTHHDPS